MFFTSLVVHLLGCSAPAPPPEPPPVAPAPPPRKLPPGLNGPEFQPLADAPLLLVPRQRDGERCIVRVVRDDPYLRRPSAMDEVATLPCLDADGLADAHPDLVSRTQAGNLAVAVAHLQRGRGDVYVDEDSFARTFGRFLPAAEAVGELGLDGLFRLDRKVVVPKPESLAPPEVDGNRLTYRLLGKPALEVTTDLGAPGWPSTETPLPTFMAGPAAILREVEAAFGGRGRALLQVPVDQGALFVLVGRDEGARSAAYVRKDVPLSKALHLELPGAFSTVTRSPEARQALAAGLFAVFGPEDHEVVRAPVVQESKLTVTAAGPDGTEVPMAIDLLDLQPDSHFTGP